MLIKYLKDAPHGKKGDIKDVDVTVGNVLILTGYAEASTEPKQDKPKEKTTKKTTAK